MKWTWGGKIERGSADAVRWEEVASEMGALLECRVRVSGGWIWKRCSQFVERKDLAVLRLLVASWGTEPMASGGFHWLLESFWPWPGTGETSDLRVSAYRNGALQCKSGCGCCLRLAENKIDGFLETELPGMHKRVGHGALSILICIYSNKMSFGTWCSAIMTMKRCWRTSGVPLFQELLFPIRFLSGFIWGIGTERYYNNIKIFKKVKKSPVFSLPYFSFISFFAYLTFT